MKTKTKKKPHCIDCGSDNIVVNSVSDWDVDNQCWTTCAVFDEFFCNDCEERNSYSDWKEADC